MKKNIEEIIKYIESEKKWYQRIELSNGLVTPGKIDSKKRLKYFKKINLINKTVIDIGCNAGYYCLWAKKYGAEKVVGIDNQQRLINQAKKLAEFESLNIDYYTESIFNIEKLGSFDYVFCFAVLTEIQDILGSIDIIKKITKDIAFIELALAKPIVYASYSKFWIKGLLNKFSLKKYHNSTGIMEVRQSKAGKMLSPSLKLLKNLFGEKFKITYLGKGIRYDMIKVKRIK